MKRVEVPTAEVNFERDAMANACIKEHTNDIGQCTKVIFVVYKIQCYVPHHDNF